MFNAYLCFRLENHSASKSCIIYWTIIKALSGYKQNKSFENSAAVATSSSGVKAL